MANIKAVVFDLYGTLIHITNEIRPYSQLFSRMSIENSEESKQARRIAMTESFDSLSAYVKKIKPESKIDLSLYEREIGKEKSSVRIFSETKKVLRELRKREIKVGLISNLASPYKSPFYEFGLEKYFNEVIFSCDVGFRKPEKEIYQIMIERLGVNSKEILMTGDKVFADVDGPKSVRMNAVHLDRKNNSIDSIASLEGIFNYL
jgi:HAD superfamily hydrolase (TIGR01549 family)